MTAISHQLPPTILHYLTRFSARRRAQRIVRALGVAIVFTLLWGLMWCLVDRMIALPAIVRLTLLMVNVLGVIALMARPMYALVRRRDWVGLARDVERLESRWDERLWTVMSRLLGPAGWSGSRQLLNALADQVAAEAAQRDAAPLLPWRSVLRPRVAALVIALAAASLALAAPVLDLPRLVTRYAMPLAGIAPAATTRLFVTPGSNEISAGQTLRVHVSAERLGESPVVLHYRRAGQSWTELAMVQSADGRFESRVSDVERDIEYYVSGGDARSGLHRATVLRRPAVAAIHVRFTYPAYTALPPRDVTIENGVIEAPAGTEATVMIEATELLSLMTMVVGGGVVQTTATEDPRIRRAALTVRDDRRYVIRMTSARGVEGVFRGGVIRAGVDRPPIVVLDAARVKREIFASEIVEIPYRALDDFGLTRLDAEIRRRGDSDRAVSIPIERGACEQGGICRLNPAALPARAGDVIEIRLRGEDRAGQFALSAPLQLSVITATATSVPDAPLITLAPSPAHLASEPAALMDPAEYANPLRAYFDAIAEPNDHDGPKTAK